MGIMKTFKHFRVNKDLSKQWMLKTAFLSRKIKLEVREIPLNSDPHELIA